MGIKKLCRSIEEVIDAHRNDGLYNLSYIPQNGTEAMTLETAKSIKEELESKQVEKIQYDGDWYTITDNTVKRNDKIVAAYFSVAVVSPVPA